MTAQEMLAQLAALLDKRDIEIESLSSQLSTAKADIRHALKEARRRQPDYPWSENTASEAIWCLGEAYGGTKAACDDLHAEIRDLRSQLAAAQAENAALRDRAANQHCAELLREVKATGERNAEPDEPVKPPKPLYRSVMQNGEPAIIRVETSDVKFALTLFDLCSKAESVRVGSSVVTLLDTSSQEKSENSLAMLTTFYDRNGITLYHGDFRELRLEPPGVSCVVTDPPYGQTSLDWDRWVKGWPALMPSNSMWCFGSLRMFTEHWGDFTGWRMSQDLVWEKHNGSGFHADRFKRVHEQAVHFYRGDWRGIYHETPTTADAVKKTVRRKERPTHMGEIENSTYTSHDGGPRLMRSVLQVRSEHGRAVHPTQKPLGIITPLIEYACPPGGVVFDPFAGVASVLLAAKELGRRAVGCEISAEFAERGAKRLEQGVLFAETRA